MNGRTVLALTGLALLAACQDDVGPTVPSGPRAGRSFFSASDTTLKFSAWSWYLAQGRTRPMIVQPYDRFRPDSSLYRVMVTQTTQIGYLRDWAHEHPGHLYIVGDEPNSNVPAQYKSPQAYAQEFCNFVTVVGSAAGDPTARFAPAGLVDSLATTYAEDFLRYRSIYSPASCTAFPIAEWTFHIFGGWSPTLVDWKAKILSRAQWARSHDAKMVLASWNLDVNGERPEGDSLYVEQLREARAWLVANPDVVHARYLEFEPYVHAHPLADENGRLKPEGLVLAGYLADNPHMLLSQSNVYEGVQLGRVYWWDQVWIDGTRYYSAIGMHAPATETGVATFSIPAGAGGFTSVFGFAADQGPECFPSPKKGRVFVDGALRWVGVISGGTLHTATAFSIAIPPGAQKLRLETDAMGSLICAHTTWGDPHYTLTAGLPPGSPYQGEFLDDNRALLISQSDVWGGLQYGRVYWQPEVWMGGALYYHALGMHVPAEGSARAEFNIPFGAEVFRSALGLARQDGASCAGVGPKRGRVYIDNELKWSGDATESSVIETGAIPIPAGASVLRLETDGLGQQWCGHTTWGNPRFLVNPADISGPDVISQPGSYTWTVSVSSLVGTYTAAWEASTDGGQHFSNVGSGTSYSREFVAAPSENPLVLRATVRLLPSGATLPPVTKTVESTICNQGACTRVGSKKIPPP